MSEKNFGAMNDAEFEEMLAEGIESTDFERDLLKLEEIAHES